MYSLCVLKKLHMALVAPACLKQLAMIIVGRTRTFSCSTGLKEMFANRLEKMRDDIANLRKKYGDRTVCEITVNQIYNGLHDAIGLISETSSVDSQNGLVIRGVNVRKLCCELPKHQKQPLPEGLFWYMLTGEIPTNDEIRLLSSDWAKRAKSRNKQLVIDNVQCFSKNLHPMAQMACVFCSLSEFSRFSREYNRHKKPVCWEVVFEDCMDLVAIAPVVAARIYNIYSNKWGAEFDDSLDWAANYVQMMGLPNKDSIDFMRLLLTLYGDHGSGNPGTHAALLASSTLADPYLAYASGVIAMAGPRHGLSCQMSADWMTKLRRAVGAKPSDEAIVNFVQKWVEDGKDIPGYEHTILKCRDPRFTFLADYTKAYASKSRLCYLVEKVSQIVPSILEASCKVKDPVPTIHVYSGPLLAFYDVTETTYYPVVFAVARALGICAQLIIAHALDLPMERPNSMSTRSLKKLVKVEKC